MIIRFILTVFVLFANLAFSFSQKNSKQNIDALNNYINYIDLTGKNCSGSLETFIVYYRQKILSDNGKAMGIDKKLIFNEVSDRKLFDIAVAQSTVLDKENADTLNLLLEKSHNIYTEITEKSNELRLYFTDQKYKSDKFAKSGTILEELSDLFIELKTSNDKLYNMIFKVYRDLQPYNNRNIYIFCEQYLRDYLEEESYMIDDWIFNLEKNGKTFKFPFNRIIRNINENDLHFWDYDSYSGLPHSVNYFYISFFQKVLTGMQEIKRNSINNYTLDEQQNDSYSNQELLKVLQFRNNNLIPDFNAFVQSCADRKVYMLKYPVKSPVFVVEKSVMNKIDMKLKYFPTRFEKIEVKPESTSISENTNMALNNFIEYINEEVKFGNELTELFRIYNEKLNEAYVENLSSPVENVYVEVRDEDLKTARCEFEKAMNNCRFLPIQYRIKINMRLKALFIITNVRNQLVTELKNYIENEEYKIDNFERAYNIIKEFEFIHYEFDIKKNELYENVKLISSIYPIVNNESSWQKTNSAIASISEVELNFLNELKSFYRDTIYIKTKPDELQTNLKKLSSQKSDLLSGIKSSGSIKNPHKLFDNITNIIPLFIQEYNEQLEEMPDTVIQRNYRPYVLLYNEIIENSNNISERAGEYVSAGGGNASPDLLIKNIYQCDIFRFIPPPSVSLEEQLFESMDGYAPNNLILLLDVSQSMKSEDRLPLLKTSFIKLLQILRAEDIVSIVSYSGSAKLAMKPEACDNKIEIENTINNLQGGGGTKLYSGLKIAYKTASEHYIPGGNNRIILATDGEFIFENNIIKIIDKYSKKGISLSVFHFGKDKDRNDLLIRIAQTGHGNYEIITPGNINIKIAQEAKAVKIK